MIAKRDAPNSIPLLHPGTVDFSQISAQLSSSPLTALPILFIAGVLTSLAPCIYPMIPITAAIVGGDDGRRCAAAALADGASHLHLRARARARVRVGRSVRGTHRHTVRRGEHQSVAVLRDGESADHRGAGDARRDSRCECRPGSSRAQRRRAREEAFTVSSSWARPRDWWRHRAPLP